MTEGNASTVRTPLEMITRLTSLRQHRTHSRARPWSDRGRECDGCGANARYAPRHAPPDCAGRDRHAWPPGPRQAPGQAASWYVGNDQADTKLAGGAAVLLGGIGLITVQGGGQGEGGAQGVQGRQQGVAVDVLGQDEVGRLMGDQGVFVL